MKYLIWQISVGDGYHSYYVKGFNRLETAIAWVKSRPKPEMYEISTEGDPVYF